MPKLEIKCHGGHVLETKEIKRDGVNLGIIEGYIATWDIDEADFFGERDRFVQGAFTESIQEHKDRNNRQIRFKDHHGRTVGGFPIDSVKQDDIGLFGVGEINLDVQQGREAFSLAKQGVLVDFSIGFIADETETDDQLRLRTISKSTIREGSIVSEPRNQAARITNVKNLDTDKFSQKLNDDYELSDDVVDKIVTDLKDMAAEAEEAAGADDNTEDSAINVAEVKEIEDLKDLEKLLKKCGFSKDAATLTIKTAIDFKDSYHGEHGDDTDDVNSNDLGEPDDDEKILTELKSLTDSIGDNTILHKLNQINQKVTNHVERNPRSR